MRRFFAWLRGRFARRQPAPVAGPVARLVVTDADGTVRHVVLRATPEMEDMPLEVALGLKPGSRVRMEREDDHV